MGEKRGNTEKMRYDFQTASNLEIFLPIKKDWYRVTSREFRSWTGKRRINEVEYDGPVYLFGMNKRVNKSSSTKNIFAGYEYKESKRQFGT